MLPQFDPTSGRLPDGEYEIDWQELVERFGWNARRRQLLDGLQEAIELLGVAGIIIGNLFYSYGSVASQPLMRVVSVLSAASM